MSEKNKKVLEYLRNSQAPQEIIDAAIYVQGALEAYEKGFEFRDKNGIKMKHKDCGYEWTYRGKLRSPGYATCPNCLGKVKIPKIEEQK